MADIDIAPGSLTQPADDQKDTPVDPSTINSQNEVGTLDQNTLAPYPGSPEPDEVGPLYPSENTD